MGEGWGEGAEVVVVLVMVISIRWAFEMEVRMAWLIEVSED